MPHCLRGKFSRQGCHNGGALTARCALHSQIATAAAAQIPPVTDELIGLANHGPEPVGHCRVSMR